MQGDAVQCVAGISWFLSGKSISDWYAYGGGAVPTSGLFVASNLLIDCVDVLWVKRWGEARVEFT